MTCFSEEDHNIEELNLKLLTPPRKVCHSNRSSTEKTVEYYQEKIEELTFYNEALKERVE